MNSNYFRTLATLMAAGIPIHLALRQQEEGSEAAISEVYGAVAGAVESGHRLSRAMSFSGSPFSPFHLGMIQVAETSGSLVAVLVRLAEYEETMGELEARIRSRLTYPALLMAVALLASLVLPPLVLKGLLDMLVSMDIELPWATQVLIVLSDCARSPFFYLTAIGLLGFVVKQWPKWRPEVYFRSRKLPYWGVLLKDVATLRFCEAMSIQCEAGVPLILAVERALEATGQPWNTLEAGAVKSRLAQGETLSESLASLEFCSKSLLLMVESGEESGRLSGAFRWLARYYKEKLEYSLDVFSALLEPVCMTILGVLFGFMAVASLEPLTRLVESL